MVSEINMKRIGACNEIECDDSPCQASEGIKENCIWVCDIFCCETEMALKDYSTDGDGLIYVCLECQHEISMFEIMTAALEKADGETWVMQGKPRDTTRLGF